MMSFLCVHGLAHASVNLQTAGWFWKIHLHELEVTYNSRSLHQGWWGQGWCSDLDVKLRQVSKNSVEFLHCSQKEKAFIQSRENGYEVNFQRRKFYFNKLLQLESVESDSTSLRLYWSGSLLTQIEINGRIYRVSLQGKYVSQFRNFQEQWDFSYQKNLLEQFVHKNALKRPNVEESFSYDGFDNLSEISGHTPHIAGKVLISYDKEDRVSRVTAPDHCSSFYSFKEFKKETQLFRLSTVERRCPFQETKGELKSVLSRFDVEENRTLRLTRVNEVTL